MAELHPLARFDARLALKGIALAFVLVMVGAPLAFERPVGSVLASKRAIEQARETMGIRGREPRLVYVQLGSVIKVTGVLPSQASLDALVARASELHGPTGLISRVEVVTGLAPTAWSDPAAVAATVPPSEPGALGYLWEVHGKDVVLRGRVVDAATKYRIEQAAAQVPGATLTGGLEVEQQVPTAPVEPGLKGAPIPIPYGTTRFRAGARGLEIAPDEIAEWSRRQTRRTERNS